MDRERVLEDQTVVIEGERIAQVGPSASVQIPKGARIVDGRGKYLIPGLVDAHVHLQSQTEFALYLANGVTTVFNLDGRPAHLLWRKQVADGRVVGPTIFSTGPIFHQKRTPEEDVKLVDEQAAAGYDGVKIYNEVSKEEYPALIAEAKKKNMLLMGHVARGPGYAMTLESGQSIAHLEEIVYTNFNPQGDDDFDHLVFDEAKIPQVVRQAKDANIYVTATLDNFAKIVGQATDLETFLKNPELNYVAPWTLEIFQPANDRYKNRFGPEKYQVLRNLLAIQRKLLKALNDGGVPLMTGTDATETGPIAGFGEQHELQEFVRDGLTPYQALKCATVNPANYLRQSNEFGTIAVGKQADMVLLAANPMTDIANAEKIEGVVVRGHWLDASELHKRLERVPQEYREESKSVGVMLSRDPAGAMHYLADHDPLGRLTAYEVSKMAETQEPADLVRMLRAMRQADSSAVSEDTINGLGYSLMNKKLYPQSIAVLRMNTEDFPTSPNTWDSLADSCAHSGDVPCAVANYQKAIAVDAGYPNAIAAKKFIAEHRPE
jgi:imidazolonepropionase-like amidohydrolase